MLLKAKNGGGASKWDNLHAPVTYKDGSSDFTLSLFTGTTSGPSSLAEGGKFEIADG